jgi:phosphoglycolate phosphatase
MPRDYDLIVFDWDGTLMDSEAKIVRCLQAAARDLGLADPGRAAIRHIIGLGLEEAMRALFPGLERARVSRLAERYRDHFLHLDDTAMPLFPGVTEGLAQLEAGGYRLAVATGKSRRGLERVLAETGTAGLFCATRCADEAGSKPDPRMLEDILELTGIESPRALMVGDTVYDLEMARHAGMAALAVSYGAHRREQLLQEQPLACLDSFPAVCAWLQ